MTRHMAPAAALALCLLLPAAALAQDFSITSMTAPSSGNTAQAAAKFKVSYTLANTGSATTSTFYVAYYFCQTTTTPQAKCQYLSRDAITGGMGAGTTKKVTSYYTLSVPTSALLGTGYVRFFADYLGYINETNENNNTNHAAITITKRPDLYPSYVAFPYSGSISTVGALRPVHRPVQRDQRWRHLQAHDRLHRDVRLLPDLQVRGWLPSARQTGRHHGHQQRLLQRLQDHPTVNHAPGRPERNPLHPYLSGLHRRGHREQGDQQRVLAHHHRGSG